jgi:hypothetical protein
MQFRNPANGYVEEIDGAMLWTFLLGPFYLGFKGLWGWAILGFVAAFFSFGLFWLVLPFFAEGVIRKHFLQKGWVEVESDNPADYIEKPKRSAKEEAEHQRKLEAAKKKMGW